MSIIQLFSSMTPEQAASLIQDDLRSFVRSELERAFNEALEGEIEGFLSEASSDKGEKVYRNGYYKRAPKTLIRPFVPKGPEGQDIPLQDGGAEAVTKVDGRPRAPRPEAVSGGPDAE